jgi:hypothetical protein
MRNVDLSRLVPGPDVWELGIVWHPTWIIEKNAPAYRPTHAWCVSQRRRRQASVGPSRPEEGDERMVLLVLTQMIRHSPYKIDKPSRILVCNQFQQTILEIHLEGRGIPIEYVEELPLVDEAEARLRANTFQPVPEGYLSQISRGVLREYAQAADEFAAAEPWLTVFDSDLIEIGPGPEDMRYCTVSGSTGKSKGFHFYESPEEHLWFTTDPASRKEIANRPRWSFTIDTGLYVPNADLDRWYDLDLPRIGGRDFPLLEQLSGDEEPTDEHIEFVTALLRGLADVGRAAWTARPCTRSSAVPTDRCRSRCRCRNWCGARRCGRRLPKPT